jgi:hypothetical protein
MEPATPPDGWPPLPVSLLELLKSFSDGYLTTLITANIITYQTGLSNRFDDLLKARFKIAK